MERRTIRGGPSLTPYWHRTQSIGTRHRLLCPCGTLIYEGPKPNFSRISCPSCKGVWDVPKDDAKEERKSDK